MTVHTVVCCLLSFRGYVYVQTALQPARLLHAACWQMAIQSTMLHVPTILQSKKVKQKAFNRVLRFRLALGLSGGPVRLNNCV